MTETIGHHPDTPLEQALAAIGNAVYAAARPAEDLEHAGQIRGNGHHLRQEMALRAQALLFDAWHDQAEKDRLDPAHPVKSAAIEY